MPPTPRRARLRLPALLVLCGLLATGLLGVSVTPASAATDPCGPSGNKISCENSKPGSPRSEWDDVQGSGDSDIQGFTTDISTNVGGTVAFKIDTDASAYSITVYRTGWYGGDGARKVATLTPSAALPQIQPQCITDASTELYDCGNWGVSASWNVPSDAVSGVYVALLRRPDNNHTSQVTFVVRDDASHSDVVFQTADPTWQAYNLYGGSDFYQGAANGRAYKISYNRPILTRGGTGGRDYYYSNEYPAVEFMERNGYDVSYIAGVDADRSGSLLTNHKTFMSVGHDEYWSKGQRANVEAARDAGVNLMFLSGNEVYWKTRYEPAASADHTDYRTLVSYKETWANAKIDPSDEWTGTWRDPRFAPTSKGGGRPENQLTGTAYMSNSDDLAMQVPAALGKSRLWRNTSVATLAAGQTATLAPHTIGYESDEDLDNGFRPGGLIRVSQTTGSTPQYLTDFGSTVVPGTTTHSMTMYRAPSGALVFGAGTIQWTWGLDANHDSAYAIEPVDVRMQQAQVNLFADMAAQPTTLQSNLVAATKSTDTTGPTVSIASPAAGSAQANGTSVTVTGTAADTGGGVVSAVEASTDGGTTWRQATGTTSWSYTYVQSGTGSVPVQVRAVDDSANIGTPATRSFAVACPCSVFGSTVPANPSTDDNGAAELGLRFSPTADGFISGVRFYKGAGNTGTHVGSLWSASGTRLAQVTFTDESTTGWQTATFATPVAVTAGTTYVVSYTAPAGHYASKSFAFSSFGIDAPPLRVTGGYGNAPGVYGNAGTYPSAGYQSTNYYVDAIFSTVDASPLVAGGQTPVAGSSSVPTTTTVSATYTKPLVTGSQGLTLKDANGTSVAGATAYDAGTRMITFTPSAPLSAFVTYTATISGTDLFGNDVSTGRTWSFTTARPDSAPGVCPCTIFGDGTTPSLPDAGDPVLVTLGTRFSSDAAGTVTGIRFYKGLNNVGLHTGTLWRADGTQLATGVFTGESTTGWQDLTLAAPVTITKGTQYVVSYTTTVGHYSATPNAFSNADLSKAPLRVTSSSGAYVYGTGFPSSSSSTSYLVDVVFQKATPSIAVAAQSPADGAVQVPRGTPISTTFTAPVAATGWTETVTQGTGSTPVAGTTTLSSDGTVLTFTPSAVLPADADVSVVLSGVTSVDGASLATQRWTFHTRGADTTYAQSLFSDQVPTTISTDDGASIELGTAFSPSQDGRVTALRFYKGAGNLGTHTGTLWSSGGVKLAGVTFTGETASGWQQATLDTPVAVTAGTSYVVSYYAPQGHYSSSPGFFANAFGNGDLSAPSANNGRYLYAVGGGFPTSSFGSTNYFVDVVFARGGSTPPVASFTSTAKYLTASFNGSGSTDPDGTVASYAWEFGDGTTGAGPKPDHLYPAAGTYTAKLTVTDDQGNVGTTSKQVTVVANVAPKAAFGLVAKANLLVSFDGTSSLDADGALASYAWDFGDGTTGTGPKPDHAYTRPGVYTVRLTVVDDAGASDTATRAVTAAVIAPPADAYGLAVFNAAPSLLWRLNETSGAAAADASGNGTTGVLSGTPAWGAASGVTGGGTALGLDGSSTTIGSAKALTNPTTYSQSMWFKTTTTAGGRLFGFQSTQTGPVGSANHDRQVYLQPGSGKLLFSTYNGVGTTLTTPKSYNDGAWHQVVATQGATGMALYVDGQLIAANVVTSNQNFTGYWRVGGNVGSYWTGNGTVGAMLNATVDEYAVHPTVLSPAQVLAQYKAALKAAPTASFTSTSTGMAASFDGSGSTDTDGTVSAYAWDFGDGTSGTGVRPTHSYPQAGTYAVTLVVTDDGGATGTLTRSVTVTAPASDVAPKASFTTTAPFLTAALDGSGSTDPDGTIASYRWEFGDGTTGTGARPTHTYPAAGTYTVKLSVVDDQGAVGTVTKQVVLVAPTNQAAGDTATQSSTAYSAPASRAVDGRTDGVFNNGSVTHSDYQAQPWWQVDLGTSTLVGSVTLWNRTDCCADRLSNGTLFVSPTDMTGKTYAQLQADPTVAELPFGTLTAASLTLPAGNVSGRYVRVQLSGTNYLSLAEVQVNGRPNALPTASFASSSTGMAATFDASGSSDPDGAVTAYAWDFGDGTTGVGAKPSHTFPQAGTYPVRLTVTDDGGATATLTKSVVVSAPTSDAPPTAAFLSTAKYLTASFDASGSTDPDGTVASYAWDFGDGTTGKGVKPDHTYAVAGTYPVRLSVVDDLGAVGTVSKPVVVAANVAPKANAAFVSKAGLLVSFDGTGSTDADGTVASYAWDFGDGTTGTGPRPDHTYARAGVYAVRLTATDNAGASDSVTLSVTAATVAPPVDAFGLSVFNAAPSLFWRLNETAGTSAGDASPNANPGILSGTGTWRVASGVTGGQTALALDGATGSLGSTKAVANPTTYSQSLWFKTTTTAGGRLFGFQSTQTGPVGSANQDRQVYLQPGSGRLLFSTFNILFGTTLTSPKAYNDGAWHQVVATQGSSGMALYVDGQLVASNGTTTSQNTTGYWRVGGNVSSRWTGNGSTGSMLNGTVDEYAVYPTALSAATVLAQYRAGTATP